MKKISLKQKSSMIMILSIDIEYRGIKNVQDLFNLSIDEDYYKPIIARGVFDGSYI